MLSSSVRTPPLIIILNAVSTDMLSLIIFSSGSINKKPEVGLGVVGTNSETVRLPPILRCISPLTKYPVTKAIA